MYKKDLSNTIVLLKVYIFVLRSATHKTCIIGATHRHVKNPRPIKKNKKAEPVKSKNVPGLGGSA